MSLPPPPPQESADVDQKELFPPLPSMPGVTVAKLPSPLKDSTVFDQALVSQEVCMHACVCVCVCVCVCAYMCVTSSRWRQGDHAVAEGDHSNTLFARRWCVLLCWMEFPTTGSVSVVGLRQWRVPLHGSSDRPMKLQRVNRVFFDPASGTNCSPHPLGLSARLMDG